MAFILLFAASIALIEGLVLGSAKSVIGYIFTSDRGIVDLVSHLMTVYCFLQFFDGLVCVCTGVFVGTGKQKIPAIANLIGYYGIGLSLSVTFIFVAKMRIFGFWLGLLICVILQSTFFIVVIFKLTWRKMTKEAMRRAHKNSDVIAAPPQALDDGHMAEGAERQRARIQGRLSMSQLLIRRGLTVFVSFGLLGLGIILHFAVPLPKATEISLYWHNSTANSNNSTTVVIQNRTS